MKSAEHADRFLAGLRPGEPDPWDEGQQTQFWDWASDAGDRQQAREIEERTTAKLPPVRENVFRMRTWAGPLTKRLTDEERQLLPPNPVRTRLGIHIGRRFSADNSDEGRSVQGGIDKGSRREKKSATRAAQAAKKMGNGANIDEQGADEGE